MVIHVISVLYIQELRDSKKNSRCLNKLYSKIIERFNNVYGDTTPFEPKPDFVLTTDPSEHVALINLEMYEGNLEWQKFLWIPPPIGESGYAMLNKKEGFKIDYLNKVFKVMNATEWAIEICDIHDIGDGVEKCSFLFLKDGDSCIVILPRVDIEKNGWNCCIDQCDLMELLAETASSVMVI